MDIFFYICHARARGLSELCVLWMIDVHLMMFWRHVRSHKIYLNLVFGCLHTTTADAIVNNGDTVTSKWNWVHVRSIIMYNHTHKNIHHHFSATTMGRLIKLSTSSMGHIHFLVFKYNNTIITTTFDARLALNFCHSFIYTKNQQYWRIMFKILIWIKACTTFFLILLLSHGYIIIKQWFGFIWFYVIQRSNEYTCVYVSSIYWTEDREQAEEKNERKNVIINSN